MNPENVIFAHLSDPRQIKCDHVSSKFSFLIKLTLDLLSNRTPMAFCAVTNRFNCSFVVGDQRIIGHKREHKSIHYLTPIEQNGDIIYALTR